MYTQLCSFLFQRPWPNHRLSLFHLPFSAEGGSSHSGNTWSHSLPRGCASRSAITGVIEIDGYRSEKNRFVEDPRRENRMDKVHMRGVLMDSVRSSVAGTEARTSGYLH